MSFVEPSVAGDGLGAVDATMDFPTTPGRSDYHGTTEYHIEMKQLQKTREFKRQLFKRIHINDKGIANATEVNKNKSSQEQLEGIIHALDRLDCDDENRMSKQMIQTIIGTGQRLVSLFDDPEIRLSEIVVRKMMEFEELLLKAEDSALSDKHNDTKLAYFSQVGMSVLADLTLILCSLIEVTDSSRPTSRQRRNRVPNYKMIPVSSECLRNDTFKRLCNALFKGPDCTMYHNPDLAGRLVTALILAEEVDPHNMGDFDRTYNLEELLRELDADPHIQKHTTSDDISTLVSVIIQNSRRCKEVHPKAIVNFQNGVDVRTGSTKSRNRAGRGEKGFNNPSIDVSLGDESQDDSSVLAQLKSSRSMPNRDTRRRRTRSTKSTKSVKTQRSQQRVGRSQSSMGTIYNRKKAHERNDSSSSMPRSSRVQIAATAAVVGATARDPSTLVPTITSRNNKDPKLSHMSSMASEMSDSHSETALAAFFRNCAEVIDVEGIAEKAMPNGRAIDSDWADECAQAKLHVALTHMVRDITQDDQLAEADAVNQLFQIFRMANQLGENNFKALHYFGINMVTYSNSIEFEEHQGCMGEYMGLIELLTDVDKDNQPCDCDGINLLKGSGISVGPIVDRLKVIGEFNKVDANGMNSLGCFPDQTTWYSFGDISKLVLRLETIEEDEMTLERMWLEVLGPWIRDNGQAIIRGNNHLRSIFQESRAKVMTLVTAGNSIMLGSDKYNEWNYGNIIMQAWSKVPENFDFLVRKKIPNLLMDAINNMTKIELQQHAVITIMELLKCDNMGDERPAFVEDCPRTNYAEKFLEVDGGRDRFINLISKGITTLKNDPSYNSGGPFNWQAIEVVIIPRLECMRLLSKTTEVFDCSEAREAVIACWDYYDEEVTGKKYYELADVEELQNAQKRTKEIKRSDSNKSTRKLAGSESFEETPVVAVSPLERRKSMQMRASINNVPYDARTAAVVKANMELQADLAGFKRRQVNEPAPASGAAGGMKRRASMMLGRAGPAAPALTAGSQPKIMDVAKMQRRMSIVPGAIEQKNKMEKEHKMIFQNDMKERNRMELSARDREYKKQLHMDENEEEDECEDVFVAALLHHIFGCMRKMLSKSWESDIDDHKFINRILALLIDPETPPSCFSNLLYCIGVIANFRAKYTNQIGDKGIELILSLIKRAYKYDGMYVSQTVSNSCIALASLVVQHPHNTTIFEDQKGIKLLVDVIKVRGNMNDSQAVNAAAALTSNLCFKHLPMKETLGSQYICEAIIGALGHYKFDPAQTVKSQNISALFKAIGNLSLNDNNMERFLNTEKYQHDKKRNEYTGSTMNNIVDVYAKFLTNADERLDANTMQASMCTLSNLVIDYKFMECFVKLVPCVLALLRREMHTDVMLHKYIFDTIANMSRQPVNAKCFGENDGIPTIMTTLPFLDPNSPVLQAAVVHCLGVQTTYPDNIVTLVQAPNSVFKWLNKYLCGYREYMKPQDKELLKLENSQGGVLLMTTLPLIIMRCATRLMVDFYCTREAVRSGFIDTLLQCFLFFKDQGMLVYEGCRCIMTAIDRYQDEMGIDTVKQGPSLTEEERNTILNQCENHYDVDQLLEEEILKNGICRFNDDEEIELCLMTDEYAAKHKKAFRVPAWRMMQSDKVKKDAPWMLDQKMQKYRQAGERPWQSIGMCSKDVKDIITAIRYCLGNAKNRTNIRLNRTGLGMMAYFSCEKIGFDAMFKRLAPNKITNDPNPVANPTVAPTFMRRMSMAVTKSPTPLPKAAPKMIQRRQSVFVSAAKAEEKATKEWSKQIDGRNKKYRIGFGKYLVKDTLKVSDIIEQAMTNLNHDENIMHQFFVLLSNMMFAAVGDLRSILTISSWTLLELFKRQVVDFEDTSAIDIEQRSNKYTSDIRFYSRILKSGGDAMLPKFEGQPGYVQSSGGNDTARFRGAKDKEEVSWYKETRIDGTDDVTDHRLLTSSDIKILRDNAKDVFDFVKCGHRLDPFPDGVYSLNEELKPDRLPRLKKLGKDLMKYLRNGATMKSINPENNQLCHLKWKSSHDLMLLEWKYIDLKEGKKKLKVDNDPTYQFKVPVTRIFKFWRGISQSAVLLANQKVKGVSEDRALVIHVLAMNDFPNGLKLNFLFDSKSNRDNHADLFSKWRESAAYGFRG
eukprot:GHVH01001424.1.p1 GENE.GHVH01001424.1~~GHVH01001424.1.p1  ORF type:complete len:2146 (+),score=298.22 GHVH01001424.1:227-6664(+)